MHDLVFAATTAPMFPVLAPESPAAQSIFDLGVRVAVISGVIFVTMVFLIALAGYRFRASRRPEATQSYGSHRSEIFWMIGPILVVLWLAAISAKLVLAINAVPEAHPEAASDTPEGPHGPRDLVVIGHQWWWEIQYPHDGITTANEIHIPIGRKLRVQVDSADVVHSFWVPQLARKIDAIPGRTNHVWLEADRPGTYQGFCAEFCGTQHAWMRFKVFAHEVEEYEAWIAAMKQPIAPGSSAQAALGATLFRSLACIECHTLEGTGSTAANGPDLTRLDQRTILAGGAVKNTPANLAAWLRNPNTFKPGSKMPDFNLTDDQIAALIAYIAPAFAPTAGTSVAPPSASPAPGTSAAPPAPTAGNGSAAAVTSAPNSGGASR